MKIQHARPQHIPELIHMLKQFASEAPVESFQQAKPDDHRLTVLLNTLMFRGVVLVAVKSEQVVGMLIGSITPDVWLPEVRSLREMAWYVLPEYRGTTAGYRLLQEYQRVGERLLQAGEVDIVSMTLMCSSPDLKLTQRGWSVLETNYILTG